MAGRCKPYKSLEVTKEDFLELLEKNNGNLYATYTALKLPYNRFAQWRNEDEEFAAEIEKIKNKTKQWVEDIMFSIIKGKKGVDAQTQARMVQFYLKTQGGYSEHKTIELQGDTTVNVADAIESIKKDLNE